MKSDEVPLRSLREIELEVEVEMREWGRQRLQQKLQQQADQHGRVFPPEPAAALARTAPDDAPGERRGPGEPGGVVRV
jgi:hypothetical protein